MVRLLHTTYLPYSYHEITEDGRHIGALSYKDGKLCWSAVNQILCGDWSFKDYLKNVEVVMQPGQAAEAGICQNGKCSIQMYVNYIPARTQTFITWLFNVHKCLQTLHVHITPQ